MTEASDSRPKALEVIRDTAFVSYVPTLFPGTVWPEVPGLWARADYVQRVWRDLWGCTTVLGASPVILGPQCELAKLNDILTTLSDDRGLDITTTLDAANQMDWPAWIQHRRSALPEPESGGGELVDPRGYKKKAFPSYYGGTSDADVAIALVPSPRCWEIPAYLRLDDTRQWMPTASALTCCLKQWHERYGCVVVGLSWDTILLKSTRRPQQGDDALELALEQFLVCPSVVWSVFQSITSLSASLSSDDDWILWWD